jgi:hypothetical protein
MFPLLVKKSKYCQKLVGLYKFLMKRTVYAGTWNVFPFGSMKERMVLTWTFEYPN